MLSGYLATIVLATFTAAHAGGADSAIPDDNLSLRFEARKQPGSSEIYEVAYVYEKKDTSGKKHDVCDSKGVALMGKQDLIQHLASVFGYKYIGDNAISEDPTQWPEYAQKRAADVIKKIDAGELWLRRCRPLHPGKSTVQAESLRLQEGGLYDQHGNTVGWLGSQDPEEGTWHYYNLIFCQTTKDIHGEEFLAVDHTKFVSAEELQERQAAIKKKLASPLLDTFNEKLLKQELSSMELYLKTISALGSSPGEASKEQSNTPASGSLMK